MWIRRIFSVVFCAAMLAAVTPAVSGAQTDPDGVLPVGQAATVTLDEGVEVAFASQSSLAADLEIHVDERPLSDVADGATDSEGAQLAPVGTEIVVVQALDADGRPVADFPHDVEVEPATETTPAQVSEFTAGVSVTLPVDAELAAGIEPHNIAVYTRATVEDPWERLPSAYDPTTGMVTANSDHLSEFAVMAASDEAGNAAQVAAGPTVVLDPDDDLGFANWPEGRESELARNLQLTTAVEVALVNACDANVVIGHSMPSTMV